MNHIDKHNEWLEEWRQIPHGDVSPQLQKVLSADTIQIPALSDKIPLEQTPEFYKIIEYYNIFKDKRYDVLDILEVGERCRDLYGFVLKLFAFKKIEISWAENVEKFCDGCMNLWDKYHLNLKSIDTYYDEIVQTVFRPLWVNKTNPFVKRQMYKFLSAYSLMKQAFAGVEREAENVELQERERYFTHLKGTMEIVLRDLPWKNLERVIIALLHDVLEDIPEYNYDVIKSIYGEYIADGVQALSKIDLKTEKTLRENLWKILDDKQLAEYDHGDEQTRKNLVNTAKKLRNKKYFWHLGERGDDGKYLLNDDYLAVKFADRIHNLSTLKGMPIKKIIFKLEQTTDYFRDVALQRMPEAYDLMREKIIDVHSYLHSQGEVFDIMEKWPKRVKPEEQTVEEIK